MPIVRFVRHAETELNKLGIFTGRTDCNITEEGFEDAKKLLNEDEKNSPSIWHSILGPIVAKKELGIEDGKEAHSNE